jgi:hypothetical protein
MQSMVCLADGTCADKNNVLYAAPPPPNGIGAGDTCSFDVPCTFNTAVSKMDDTRNIVKMTTTHGTDYNEPGVAIPHAGTIIGTGAIFTPMGAGPGISMTNLASLEILGITIQSSPAEGIKCTGTPLQVRRVTINGSKTVGLQTTNCDATVERSKFTRNLGGAMFLSKGTFEVRNNIVAPENGDAGLDTGNLHLDMAKGRVVFNTVVDNNGKANKPAGINCTGSGMLYVGQNISTANGDNRAISNLNGDCPHTNNFTDTLAKAAFRNAATNDYHLTIDSPTLDPYLRDDPTADTPPIHACRLPGSGPQGPYIDDYEGYLRPFKQFCDRGAYEYHE